MLLAPELFRIHALAGTRLEGKECNILCEVQRSLRDRVQEEAVAKVARKLWKDKCRGTVKSAEWSESDGLFMFCGKIYVPNDRDLQCCIIEQHHDMRITGHAGHFKTLELVVCNYWWLQMSQYIGIYIKTCDLCNRMKLQHQQPFSELHPPETAVAPWDTISVDFIVELPESHGYDTSMNVVDSVTKCTHLISMHTTITAKGAARLYLRGVRKHHGMPQVALLDRGSQLTPGFTHELYKLLKIKLAVLTAYHPQTNGQTEHVNQELEGYLCIFTSRRQDDCDNLLPLGEFSHNNNVHSSTQQTPFMVDT
jgi:hypothetical protein